MRHAVVITLIVATLAPAAPAGATPPWKAATRRLRRLRPVHKSVVKAIAPLEDGRLRVTMQLSSKGTAIARPRVTTRTLTLEPGQRVRVNGGLRNWLAHPLYVQAAGKDGVVFTRVKRDGSPTSGERWLTWQGRPTPVKSVLRELRQDPALRDNEPAVLRLVRSLGQALGSASPRLRAKPAVVRAAMEQDPRAIVHALGPAANDRALWRAAVRQDPGVIAHAPQEIRNEARLVSAAAEAAPEATVRHLPYRFRADPAFMLRVVQKDGRALQFASRAVRADPKVALAAVRQNPEAAAFVASELLLQPAFRRAARRWWRGRRAMARAVRTAERFQSGQAPAGRYTPQQVLDDFNRFAGKHPRAIISSAFTEADAINFHRITGGKALPSDFMGVYDRALATARAGVRIDGRALNVGANEVSWNLELKGPSGRQGTIRCSINDKGTVHHGLLKFSPGMQGNGLMPLLSIAHDNLYLRLGVKQVTLTAALTAGPYVWARNYFATSPDRFAKIKKELVGFLGAKDKQLRAAGVTGAEIDALRARVAATKTLWGLAGLRIPGKQIQVTNRAAWGLLPDHKAGGYDIGKLFFLSQRPTYQGVKDYSEGRRGVQVKLGRKRHLRSAIRARWTAKQPPRYSNVKAMIRELDAL